MVLAGMGVAVLVAFGSVALQSVGEFRRVQQARQGRPGEAVQELQFFVVSTKMGLLVGGAVAGALLALNGLTLVWIGRMAGAEEGDR
jgi:hypothetical protein